MELSILYVLLQPLRQKVELLGSAKLNLVLRKFIGLICSVFFPNFSAGFSTVFVEHAAAPPV